MDVKAELARKTEKREVKLTKSMTIVDMVKALEPEIQRALPAVLTPERFTRMALSAINNTPRLAECTPMTFIAALMNAAQLGLEPNTPLGQAYLIPYENKKQNCVECQFQIGYKGYIDLAYRTGQVQMIQAQAVHEKDEFDYAYGLNPRLFHRPSDGERGDIRYFYGLFRLGNGGYGFEVMNREAMDAHARTYSQAVTSQYSPWNKNYEDMAKKTVIKKVLKYAPISTDFQKAVSMDESIKTELSVDMSEIRNTYLEDGIETGDAA